MAGDHDVRADDHPSDIEPKVLRGDLQGEVSSAEDLSADRQYPAFAVLCVYSVIGHDDEPIRDALYERDPAVDDCPTGASGFVALVVRVDGAAPRAALRHHRFKAEKPHGEDRGGRCDGRCLRLWLLPVLQVGYTQIHAVSKSLCLSRLFQGVVAGAPREPFYAPRVGFRGISAVAWVEKAHAQKAQYIRRK